MTHPHPDHSRLRRSGVVTGKAIEIVARIVVENVACSSVEVYSTVPVFQRACFCSLLFCGKATCETWVDCFHQFDCAGTWAKFHSPRNTTRLCRWIHALTTWDSSSLAEVVDRILDKGIVIDVWAKVPLVGIELLSIKARVVIASVETYLKYAEAIGLTASAAAPA